MPAWLFALLLALAAVLLILALVWLGFYLLKRHRRRQPRTTRFIRGDIGVAQLEDKVRKEGRSLSRSTSMTSAAARGTEANRSRFYIFAGLFSVLFGGLLVKLWSLQIFQGSYYAGKAAANMAETVNLPAARGRILDRNKKVLATNSSMTVLTASKTLASDSGVIHRLSLVLGIPRAEIKKNLLDDTTGQGASRVFAEDISVRQVAFIKEHPTLFSGVNVDVRAVRHYPHASLACHILGYTGSPTAADLKATDANGNLLHQATDVVGKDGIELQYESLLSGTNGYQKYVVSSDGESVQLADQVDPVNGNDICLTIDIELQERTDQILKTLIKTTRQGFYKHADAGALICIDVEDGGILAMSSYPTYKPQELSDGISTELWSSLLDKKSSYPLTNRAVSGVYPAASTFKAFSSMAGLQFGIIGPDTTHDCKGYWDAYGKQWGQKCWIYPGHHGVLGLEEAIKHSCDIYFYNVGADFYKAWQAEPAQARVDDYQNYVKTWGFGSVSGIDLPGEASGRIPDAAWKAQTFVDTPEEAQWQPGDMTNMCIGQGDILVTPLQICNGYAAIARRQMLTPHLFKSALDSDAAPVVTYTPIPPTTTPEVVPEHVKRVERGCEMVVTQTNLFDDLPIKVAGKSGTGEVSGKDDISWYVAYGPVEKPKYCVVCVVEQGGGGSTTAIQGVAQTFAKLYDTSAGSITLRSATNER